MPHLNENSRNFYKFHFVLSIFGKKRKNAHGMDGEKSTYLLNVELLHELKNEMASHQATEKENFIHRLMMIVRLHAIR